MSAQLALSDRAMAVRNVLLSQPLLHIRDTNFMRLKRSLTGVAIMLPSWSKFGIIKDDATGDATWPDLVEHAP